MSAWLKKSLENYGPAWVVIALIVLVLGDDGLERLIDRVLPGEASTSSSGQSVTLSTQIARFSRKTDERLKAMADNQGQIIGMLGEIATEMDTASLTDLQLAARISRLERSFPPLGTLPRSPGDTHP